MEVINSIVMNSKEQWFGFYKSLRDILRDGTSKYTGMEAFNEINTLLILVFLEDKLDNFDIKNIEMCKFTYIYDLFFTRVEKKIKDEKIKEPQLSQLMKNTKLELFRYLFDKRRNFEVQNKTESSISFIQREEITGDIYFKHYPSVFVQILKTSGLNRLFIRTKMNDNDNAVDISTITGFIEDHSGDVYSLIKKIAETFYIKNVDGKLESILNNNDLDFDALGGAYEKFMTDDTMNSKNTGEFFTRRDLINFIVKQFSINENDIVYDSSVGTGGFLLECIRIVKNKLLEDLKQGKINESTFQQKFDNFLEKNVHGNEIKPNLYKSLMLNILMNDPKGLCLENLLCIDSMLIDDDEIGNKTKSLNFSTISTGNPPYGCSLDKTPSNITIRNIDGEEEYDDESKENYFSPIMSGKNIIKNSSGQFIMHLIRCLKQNGKAGFIIDRGVLINGTDSKKSWNKSLRKFMIENNNLTKIVLLPTGIFEHTNFATCVIFLTKGGKTSKVEFQELYFKDEDKGIGFKKFYEGNSWNVSFQQLKEKEYSLDPKDFNIPLMEYQKKGNNEIVEMKTELSSIPVEWKKIKDFISFEIGKTPSTKEPYLYDGNIPWVQIGDMKTKYITDTEKHISIDAQKLFVIKKTNKDNCADIGDLLFSFKLSIGKVAIAKCKLYCNEAIAIFKSNEIVNVNYLYYIFQIINFYEKASGNMSKGSLNKDKIKDLDIPIPSLENQQKIIDKLDTYFGEESIYKFDLNIIMKYENGNRLLNYIFNEEWSKFLDCVEKAQRIDDLKSIKTNQLLTEMSNRTIIKFNPDTKSKTKTNIEEFVIETFLKKEFDFISKDMEFESKKIKDVCDFTRGKSKLIKDINGQYNIIGGGKGFIGKHNSYLVNENLPILSISGANAGIVQKFNEKIMMSADAFSIFSKNNNNLSNIYLFYFLKINENKYKNMQHGNGQPHFYPRDLEPLEIPIPSLANQQIIVKYLDEKIEYHKTYWASMSQMFSNDSLELLDETNNLETSDNLDNDEDNVV